MSLRREMLQVARLASRLLGEAGDLVEGFVRGQWNADGGVRDRAGASDLYYTVFAMESLQALQRPVPESVRGYLAGFAAGDGLDFVHRCCLARGWAMLGVDGFPQRDELARAIGAYRSADGGYAQRSGEAHGTSYAAFLAIGALQDLGAPLPAANEIAAALMPLRSADGGYANHPGATHGVTPATVSAVMVMHACGLRTPADTGAWLTARFHHQGGFLANPLAPFPDLLCTATALHALACLEQPLPAPQVEATLDFVDTLWTNTGAFHGHWAEDELDVEYTYYGLLALGHLSL